MPAIPFLEMRDSAGEADQIIPAYRTVICAKLQAPGLMISKAFRIGAKDPFPRHAAADPQAAVGDPPPNAPAAHEKLPEV